MTKMGICALVLILFTINLVPLVTVGQTEELVPQPEVEWTFMVYMDGDNNLEGPGVEDFNEMEEAFKYSTYQVNVIVQFDRIGGYDTSNGDWEDCRRYAIQKDFDKSEMTSEVVKDMGEVNMGDPDTLVDFVTWGFEYYPAKKYAVVLWDHGGAWRGVCWDDTNLTESGDADCITLPELRYALREIKQANNNRNLDLLGFDACSMAQTAIVHEVVDYVDVVCASGFVEPGDGWPYEMILPDLLAQPTMTKEELGERIAYHYQSSYSDRTEDPDDSFRTSMAAFNTTMFPQYVQALNKFSFELAKVAGDHYDSIMEARSRALSYDMAPFGPFTLTGYCLTDVTDFCMKIIDPDRPKDFQFIVEHPEVTTAAQKVIDTQESATIKVYSYPALDEKNPTAKRAYGLTVYFPNDQDTHWDVRMDDFAFTQHMFWDNFLQSYLFPKKNAGNTPPTCLITYPKDVNETLNQDDLYAPVTGVAFDDESVQTVEISIDGGEWEAVEIIPGQSVNWYYNLNVKDLEPGQHTIEARAFDEKQNGESPHYTISIYVEESETKEEGDRGIPIDFNFIAIAIIISLIVLGVAILIRDKRKNYR
jgi:hypothetical protein